MPNSIIYTMSEDTTADSQWVSSDRAESNGESNPLTSSCNITMPQEMRPPASLPPAFLNSVQQQRRRCGRSNPPSFVLMAPESRKRVITTEFLQPRSSSLRFIPSNRSSMTDAPLSSSPSFTELDAATPSFQSEIDTRRSTSSARFRRISIPEEPAPIVGEQDSLSPIKLAMKPVDRDFDIQALLPGDCVKSGRACPVVWVSPGSSSAEVPASAPTNTTIQRPQPSRLPPNQRQAPFTSLDGVSSVPPSVVPGLPQLGGRKQDDQWVRSSKDEMMFDLQS